MGKHLSVYRHCRIEHAQQQLHCSTAVSQFMNLICPSVRKTMASVVFVTLHRVYELRENSTKASVCKPNFPQTKAFMNRDTIIYSFD